MFRIGFHRRFGCARRVVQLIVNVSSDCSRALRARTPHECQPERFPDRPDVQARTAREPVRGQVALLIDSRDA